MARIIYDEPNKKEYNKIRKNWNKTYNKKNKKYKGIEFEMDNVESETKHPILTYIKSLILLMIIFGIIIYRFRYELEPLFEIIKSTFL